MSFWYIHPATGKPLQGSADGNYVMGDSFWDFAELAVNRILEIVPEAKKFTKEKLRQLFAFARSKRRRGDLPAAEFQQVTDILDEMWDAIGEVYEEDIGRSFKPVERKWIVEHMVSHCRSQR